MSNPQTLRGTQVVQLLGGRFRDDPNIVPFGFELGSESGMTVGPPGTPTNFRLASFSLNAAHNPNDLSGAVRGWTLSLAWDIPSDNGSPITGYEIENIRSRDIVTGIGGETWPINGDIFNNRTYETITVPHSLSLPFFWWQRAFQSQFVTQMQGTMTVKHELRVRALNEHGPGGWSGVLTLTHSGQHSNGNPIATIISNFMDSGGGTPPPAATPPSQVTPAPMATDGSSEIDVSWTEPTAGGSAIGYDIDIQTRSSSASSWADVPGAHVEVTTTSYAFPIPTNTAVGQQYRFQVRATGSGGDGAWSDWSNTASVIAAPPPNQAPGQVDASTANAVPGDTIADLAWSQPSGGTPTDYDIQLRKDATGGTNYGNSIDKSFSGTLRIARLQSLVNGDRYQFRIRASNSHGTGAWSDWFPTAGIVPNADPVTAPRNVSAAAGDTQNTLTWDLPLNVLATQIQTYNLQYQTRAFDATDSWEAVTSAGVMKYPIRDISGYAGSDRTFTHTGLTNGEVYRYRVRAVVGGTNGEWSDWTSPVAPVMSQEPPDAPLSIGGIAGNQSIQASFTKASTGGPVSQFHVQYAAAATHPSLPNWSDSIIVGASENRVTIPNLTNGTTYLLRVRAVNANGMSGWRTSTGSAIIPFGPPLKPSAPNARFIVSQAGYTFSASGMAPVTNGRSITGYKWRLQRRVQGGSPNDQWTQIVDGESTTTPNFSRITHVPGAGTPAGIDWRTSFRAINVGGEGPYSDWTVVDGDGA